MRFTSSSGSITISDCNYIALEYQPMYDLQGDDWKQLPINEEIIIDNLDPDTAYVFRHVDAPHIRYVIMTLSNYLYQLFI